MAKMTREETIENFDDECWRCIEGFPNYKVSSMGRILALNFQRTHTEKILKPQVGSRGYLHISLSNNGRVYTKRINRLVAKAFLPNPNNLPCVNHKDENKLNNRVENLEWCTYQYNSNYGTGIERCSQKRINDINRSKKIVMMKDGIVVKIFPSLRECRRCGYNSQIISQLCNHKKNCRYKTHKGYTWKFYNEHLVGTTNNPETK